MAKPQVTAGQLLKESGYYQFIPSLSLLNGAMLLIIITKLSILLLGISLLAFPFYPMILHLMANEFDPDFIRIKKIKQTHYGKAIEHLMNESQSKYISEMARNNIDATIKELWIKANYDLGFVKLEIPVPELPKDTTDSDSALLLAQEYRERLLNESNSEAIKQEEVDKAVEEIDKK